MIVNKILFLMNYGKGLLSTPYDRKLETHVNFDEKFRIMEKSIRNSYKGKVIIDRIDPQINSSSLKQLEDVFIAPSILIVDTMNLSPSIIYIISRRLNQNRLIVFTYHKEYKNTKSINHFKNQVCKLKEWDELLEELKRNIDCIFSTISQSEVGTDLKYSISLNGKWGDFYNNHNRNNDLIYRLHLVKDNVKYFHGSENFDQKHSAAVYRANLLNVSGLKEALEIIEEQSPLTSINYKTIGLACSISRKIYELNGEDIYKIKSFNYSSHFISIFKGPYPYSSLALHLIALMERNEINKETYILMALKLREFFYSDCIQEHDEIYYDHTQKLIDAMMGTRTEFYNDSNFPKYSKGTKIAYERAIQVFENYII